MKPSYLNDLALVVLLALGVSGAASISYENFTSSPCPHLAFIPVCYLVLAAYLTMTASILVKHNGCRHYFFIVGWGLAFIIALVGTLAEAFAGGGVCPSSSGGIRSAGTNLSVPLCYISLGMLIVILVLFLTGPYKRACQRNLDSTTTDQN